MRKQLQSPRLVVLILLVALSAIFVGAGCEENCVDSERAYERALSAEQTNLVEVDGLSGDSPAQFGLALKTELLGDLVNIVLQPAIKGALTLVSTIEVDGERVGLETEGDVLNIRVDADPACDHCFRLTARLDGAVTADIPSWGEERATLGGAFSIVAPLLLERGDNADAALKLDLPAMVDVGQSELSTRLSDVDPDVADMLEAPLADFLLDVLARELDPVTLVEFDAPSFGIPGFEVLPVQLVTDDTTGTVFAGFATNVEALNVPGAVGVEPITDLGANENVALAFQPAIIGHSLSLLMSDGQVPRTYNLSGSADERGNAHVALDGFRVGHDLLDDPTTGDDTGYGDAGFSADTGYSDPGYSNPPDLPFALGFQVFNLSSQEGFCFGFGAEAVGGVSVRESSLEVDLLDVRFTDAFLQRNLVELSNWMNADFVQESRTLVSQSLDKATVTVPGTDLSLGASGIELRPNAVVLRAQSTPTPAADTQ